METIAEIIRFITAVSFAMSLVTMWTILLKDCEYALKNIITTTLLMASVILYPQYGFVLSSAMYCLFIVIFIYRIFHLKSRCSKTENRYIFFLNLSLVIALLCQNNHLFHEIIMNGKEFMQMVSALIS